MDLGFWRFGVLGFGVLGFGVLGSWGFAVLGVLVRWALGFEKA